MNDFLAFLHASGSPFHAVKEIKCKLLKAGYVQLMESQAFQCVPGGKYFVTRNQSSIVAFQIPKRFRGSSPFHIIGAHTDSPCLKLKPCSNIESHGYSQLQVQVYGGGIWHTWFDRDLGLSGRVMVEGNDGKLEGHLVRFDRPILRIPTLAIHLDRGVNEKFVFNEETHLVPIIETTTKEKGEENKSKNHIHNPNLLKKISEQISVKVESIRDFELCLHDVAPPCIGGLDESFIFSPRLDNLAMSYCALDALLKMNISQDSSAISMIALFDHEEVGSNSAFGAASNFVESVMQRVLSYAPGEKHPDDYGRSISKSFLISADMAHAVHPNYAEKHAKGHAPSLKNLVLKINANQRYTTTSLTSSLLKKMGVELQEFVVRNDSPCGSTIGPILSKIGIRSVDIGAPMLSMHSIREMCGIHVIDESTKLFVNFFEIFEKIDCETE